MILVGTDVMIDVMRRHGPAIVWLDSLGTEVIGIPGLVAMELLQGFRNREEQGQLERFLRPCQRFWPSQADCARASDDYAAYHLSHDAGIPHTLFATQPHRRTYCVTEGRVRPDPNQPYSSIPLA